MLFLPGCTLTVPEPARNCLVTPIVLVHFAAANNVVAALLSKGVCKGGKQLRQSRVDENGQNTMRMHATKHTGKVIELDHGVPLAPVGDLACAHAVARVHGDVFVEGLLATGGVEVVDRGAVLEITVLLRLAQDAGRGEVRRHLDGGAAVLA